MNEYAYDGGSVASFFGFFGWLVLIAIYAYTSYSIYRIAYKTGDEDNAWLAWIPIVNTFLLIKMAQKEWWWFLTLLVPVVNIIMFGILWAEAAKKAGHPAYWGVLVLVPFVGFVALGVLAFGTPDRPQPALPSESDPQPKQPEHVG